MRWARRAANGSLSSSAAPAPASSVPGAHGSLHTNARLIPYHTINLVAHVSNGHLPRRKIASMHHAFDSSNHHPSLVHRDIYHPFATPGLHLIWPPQPLIFKITQLHFFIFLVPWWYPGAVRNRSVHGDYAPTHSLRLSSAIRLDHVNPVVSTA